MIFEFAGGINGRVFYNAVLEAFGSNQVRLQEDKNFPRAKKLELFYAEAWTSFLFINHPESQMTRYMDLEGRIYYFTIMDSSGAYCCEPYQHLTNHFKKI